MEQIERFPVHDAGKPGEVDDNGLLVLRGLSEALRGQLVNKSQEPHIIEWTPRDAEERFMTEDTIRNREQDTEYYPLVMREDGSEDLAGIVWFSPRPADGLNYTFAVRMYEGYAGRKLASPFVRTAINDFLLLHPIEHGIWLSVDRNNAPARHLYEKLGFISKINAGDQSREIMTKMLEAKNPKIVVIGGGTGSFTVLSGLKHYTDNLTAVVNMSDDGGSSGELRDELGVLPPGDVRQCLVALSDNEVMRRIFEYRLKGGKLDNHTLGNLLLSGIEQMTGDFEEAISQLSQLLNITGRVVPVTTTKAKLHARLKDGSEVVGEETIGHMATGADRPEIWLEPEAQITNSAKQAIEDADIVVIAPGNLYGSLAPALVVNGIRESLQAAKARKVYISNLVTKPGQTEGFKAHDFAEEIERLIGAQVLTDVIYNTDEPTPSMLAHYTHDGEFMLDFDLEEFHNKPYRAIGLPLIAKDPVNHNENDRLKGRRTLIRHDSDQLAKEIIKLLSI